ncbi:MAG TPA: zinc-ribbon domain-containing protein [Anaerolineae bacterium]|nr:zinc-ribbon domain-containing protein [Anaerolineae bacterium]
MKCPNCGKEIPEGKAFCGYCGASMAAEKPSDSEDRAPRIVEAPKLMKEGLVEGKKSIEGRSTQVINTMGIISIVFAVAGGILALVSFFLGPWFQLIALPVTVAGLILGFVGLRSRPQGFAIAGILINALVLIFNLPWVFRALIVILE